MTLRYCDLGDGTRMPYVELGDPTGAPLLVLRGLGDALSTVESSATVEKARALYGPLLHHRLVVTSWPVPARPGLRFTDLAADARTLITELRIGPTAIWGNSMGGMIALVLAEGDPDLVDAIVCECTPSHVGRPLTDHLDRWDALARARKWSVLQRDTLRRIFTGRMPMAIRLMLPFTRWIPVPDDPDRWQVLSTALREFDLRDRAEAVRCPVLVIGGRQDIMTPPDQLADLADRLPDGRAVFVERCGHGAAAEQPEAFFTAVADFLPPRYSRAA